MLRRMRWIKIVGGGLVGLVVLSLVLVFGISEAGGEIVTLETRDANGEPKTTRLWVVDHDGSAWLRSGQPTSGWFVRLEAAPSVRVTRNGETVEYTAEPVRDPAVRDRIHALMAEKYTWAESFVAGSRDGTLSIPVRLVPRPAS